MNRLYWLALLFAAGCSSLQVDQRESRFYLRGPYNFATYDRHPLVYRDGAAIHYAHAKAHDVLQLTPETSASAVDGETAADFKQAVLDSQVRIEPHMEYFGPYTARFAWNLYRAIDWTHMHHEQTYDILSSTEIPWSKKDKWTRRAVDYYLTKNDFPRSPAPLDITMRRAGVMMKPYFGAFRNKYPDSNNFFFAAHWWHPAVYEAQIMGGNGASQDKYVDRVERTSHDVVMRQPPLRMILSREMMPRYSRFSPESANIFDNLHMLHGIAYDILAFEGWTPEQKRKELYRVIAAMAYQPGDEQYARKFSLPHSDVIPWKYESWMQGVNGEMNRIMKEMMLEMMPMMMREPMSPEMKEKVMHQLRLKLTPGMQQGEIEGSLHDAMMKLMPDMKMDHDALEAGATPQKMIDTMLAGWKSKYGSLPDVAPLPMSNGQAEEGIP